MDSSRSFLRRMRERMRPKHYAEVTDEERRKSGRHITYDRDDIARLKAHPAARRSRPFAVTVGITVAAAAVFMFGSGILALLLFVAVLFCMGRSVWEAHHPKTPVIDDRLRHIRLKREKEKDI